MKIKHINYIFLLSDQEFVEQAFSLILGRAVDEEGYQNYYSQLKLGLSKADILYQIAISTEAKKINRNIPGLSLFIRKYRKKYLGIFGFLFRNRINYSKINEIVQPPRENFNTSTYNKNNYNNAQDLEISEKLGFISKSIEGLISRINHIEETIKILQSYNGNKEEITQYKATEISDITLQLGYTIDKLLKIENNVEFIKKTYQAVLHRQADEEGMNYFLQEITNGKSKVEIIQHLLMVDEAKSVPNKIEQIEERLNFIHSSLEGIQIHLVNSGAKNK